MPPVGTAHDLCADCLATFGKLCDRCKPTVLPQLARNIGWLKLMGEAHAEQTRLQEQDETTVAVERAKRRNDRRQARSGVRGLLVHVRTALPPRCGEVEELNFDHRNYPPTA